MSEGGNLYFLDVKLQTASQNGIDLSGHINKINSILCDYAKATVCRHKFKVTGEPRLIAVFEASNVIGLERTISGLARLGYVDVTCKPLIPYEDFASYNGLEPHLTQKTPNTVADDAELFWLDFNVDHHGKHIDELLDIWKKEAVATLGAKAGGLRIELFKVVAERKVHAFIATPAEELDKMTFTLPLMKLNGENVTISCQAIQSLDTYSTKMNSESHQYITSPNK